MKSKLQTGNGQVKTDCVEIVVSHEMLNAAYGAIATQIDFDNCGLHGSVIVLPILEALQAASKDDIRFRVSAVPAARKTLRLPAPLRPERPSLET